MTNKRSGDIFTFGFGATVLMWIVLYITAMPLGIVPLPLAAILVGLLLLVVGYLRGRATGCSWAGGATLGLLIGFINLLILSSMLGGNDPGEFLVSGLWWIGGFLVTAVVLCAIGAGLSKQNEKYLTCPPNWTFRLALVTASTTLLMLISGGIVTGLEAGLAIEGWLTSDGYLMVLFPLELMTRDVGSFAEHSHRLWGLLVGLTTIVLAVKVFVDGRSKGVKTLVVIAVIAVIIQGAMGGFRVTDQSIVLGIAHGVFGQMFFALLVVIAAVLSNAWDNSKPIVKANVKTDYTLSVILIAFLLLQITLGTVFRHIHPLEDLSRGARMGLLHGHSFIGSTAAAVLILWCSLRAWGMYKEQPLVHRVGKSMMHTLGLQIVLGFASFIIVPHDVRGSDESITTHEVVITTAHQATGALLLGICVLYAVLLRRLVKTT
ncbi:MAG: COX15/CtaA family protein [Planctomycetes bacterium]|nr:COX15/CtaA family protein [Planctomycetota bacterium]